MHNSHTEQNFLVSFSKPVWIKSPKHQFPHLKIEVHLRFFFKTAVNEESIH